MASSHIDYIYRTLDQVHSFRRALYVGERVLAYLCVSTGLVILFSLVGGIWDLPGALRWFMLVCLVFVVGGGFVTNVILPLRRRWSREQFARRLEIHFPELGNALINAVQLAEAPRVGPRGFVDRVVRDAAQVVARHDFSRAFFMGRLHRFAWAGSLITILLGIYACTLPQNFSSGISQVVYPGSFIPPQSRIEIRVAPGNKTVFRGDEMPVEAVLLSERPSLEGITVNIATDLPGERSERSSRVGRPAPTEQAPQMMIPAGPNRFVYVFREVKTSFSYWVTAGRYRSETYRVTIAYRPEIERIELEYVYPEYTGIPRANEPDSDGTIRCVKGTSVKLKVKIGPKGKQLSAAQIAFGSGAQAPPTTVGAAGDSFETRFIVTRDDTYTIHLTDTEDYSNRDPQRHRIVCIPDTVPKVAIVRPGKSVTAAVGDTVPVVMEATDDFGVAGIALLARVNNTGAVKRIAAWNQFPNRKVARVLFDWRISSRDVKPGDRILYFAEARDGNPLHEPVRSRRFEINIIDPKKRLAEAKAAVADWEKALREVLALQKETRDKTQAIADSYNLQTSRNMARQIAAAQARIRSRTRDIREKMSSSYMRTAEIRQALAWLMAGPMAEAVRLAESAATQPTPENARGSLKLLVPEQDKIIGLLERILGVLPKLAEAPNTPEPEDDGGDIPDDSLQNEMDKLKENLKELVDEQKKVIDSTADLAKQPVDDFTMEDDREVKKLEAKEDKWSDFLKDTFSDFSKVPEQDFSNPSMLKELIETSLKSRWPRTPCPRRPLRSPHLLRRTARNWPKP